MDVKITEEQLDMLVQNTCFAADGAAMDERAKGVTNAQITRAVVRRTIEFLIGNDLVEFKSTGEGTWMNIEPPYEGVGSD